MPGTTTNRANRFPVGADAANVPSDITNLANDLDNVANIYTGTFAGRPAAVATAGHGSANPGSFYFATDTGELFLNIAGAWVKITTEAGIPLGGMMPYGGTGDPSDTRFLLADGRAIARAGQYAPLFTVVGTSYGAGDGSTTFNLPDKRGRVSMGQDNMGTAQGAANRVPNSNRAKGQNGGVERYTLAAAESGVPAHTHSDSGHAHTQPAHSHVAGDGGQLLARQDNSAGGFFAASGGGGTLSVAWYAGTNGAGPTTNNGNANILNNTAAAAANPHQNMQPYEVDNYLIRVK
jgi:microcystin-dependent protein